MKFTSEDLVKHIMELNDLKVGEKFNIEDSEFEDNPAYFNEKLELTDNKGKVRIIGWIIDSEIKKLPVKTYSRLKLVEGERFWSVNLHGDVVGASYPETYTDYFWDNTIYYRTEEECEEYLEVHRQLKALSFEPDWRDGKQLKYYIGYNTIRDDIDWLTTMKYQSEVKYYFTNVGYEEAIKIGKDKLKRYYLGIEE